MCIFVALKRQTETMIIDKVADTSRRSEARLQKVAELAEGILKMCPNLKTFSQWSIWVEDEFTSELEHAVRYLLHPSGLMAW